jgi:uncharacterized protein
MLFVVAVSLPDITPLPAQMSQTGATDPKDRIQTIDILRGIALFGVLMVNLLTEFRVSIFQQFVPTALAGSPMDRLLTGFVTYALDMKAFALFSLLFGVGLAIQFDRLAPRGRAPYWLRRRLIVLLAFGLCHLLIIWNGDILTEYALAGLLLLPLIRQDKTTVAFYSLAMLAFYFAMPLLYIPAYWPSTYAFSLDVQAANHVYPDGSFLTILQFSAHELKLMLPLHESVFPRTLALMLLGAWVWKVGLLQDLQQHRYKLLVFGLISTAMGVGATLAESGNLLAGQPLIGDVLSRLGPAVQALGYAALIAVAASQPYLERILRVFAPLGRMAFTNYILESLIFSWIFMGYGLGQFGRLSETTAFVLGIVVYVGQLIASLLWLRRFRFGPLEWLWRTLMYGQSQPMWKATLGPAELQR